MSSSLPSVKQSTVHCFSEGVKSSGCQSYRPHSHFAKGELMFQLAIMCGRFSRDTTRHAYGSSFT